LQGGKSVKRQRTMQRRFALGRKISVAAILIILFVTGGYFVTTKLNRRADGLQKLLPSELAAMEGTKNLKAYKKYVQGRTAMRQRNRAGLTEGLKLMREAVDLDPGFLRAWTELHMNYVLGRWKDAEANTQIRLIVKRLEELNPNSAEAHFTKGSLAIADGKNVEAEKEFQRAIQLDPSRPYAHSLYAAFLIPRGRLHEARQQLEQCENLDPGFWMVPDLRGDCFYVERYYPAAIAEYEKALSLAHQNIGAYERLGRLYEANHQIANAIDDFQKASTFASQDPEKIAPRYDALRLAFREEGERGYWLKRLEQVQAELDPEKAPYAFAVLHARLGHRDQALALLEKAWHVNDGGLAALILDQCWDDMRDNERLKELLKKIGFRTDWPIK
jgi:tetratricopeptide (TPR) repeat protein